MEDKNISSNTNERPVARAQEFEVCVEDIRKVEALKCSQLQSALDNQKDKVYRQSRELAIKDKVIMVLGETIDSLASEIRYLKEIK